MAISVKKTVTNIKNKSTPKKKVVVKGSAGGGYVNKAGKSNVKKPSLAAWKKKQPKSVLDK